MKRLMLFLMLMLMLVSSNFPIQVKAYENITFNEYFDGIQGLSGETYEFVLNYDYADNIYFMHYVIGEYEYLLLSESPWMRFDLKTDDLVSCSFDMVNWGTGYYFSIYGGELITFNPSQFWIEKGLNYPYLDFVNSNYNVDLSVLSTAGSSVDSNVGYSDYITDLKPHFHSFSQKESLPTCVTDGLNWEECECGEIQNEVIIPALGHGVLIDEVTKEPTAEEEGTYKKICSVCGEVVESGDIPKVSPTPTPTSTPTPTPSPTPSPKPVCSHTWETKDDFMNCTYSFRTWEECTLCGIVQNKITVPASEHIYDDDSDNICNVCNYNRDIEQLGDFIDLIPIILSLFWVFPLNIFIIVYLFVLSVILYRRLKKK